MKKAGGTLLDRFRRHLLLLAVRAAVNRANLGDLGSPVVRSDRDVTGWVLNGKGVNGA